MEPGPISASVMRRFGLRWQVLMVLLFNTLVGAVLALAPGAPVAARELWHFVLYSQCVGFSIFGAIHLSARWAGRAGCPLPRDLALGVVIGAVLGNLLGGLLTGGLALGAARFGGYLFIALAFGAFGANFFFSTFRIAQGQDDLRQQETRRLTAEAQLVETRLRLLQAQIEPHFLFNTLSNIHGLIETDPARASRMLESLTRLLRASLKRTRAGDTTLGDELALVRAYLEIQSERMGTRLCFSIDAPLELLSCPFPPLLIQPLVENAVQHGIEPTVDGGSVTVRVRGDGMKLRVEVADTGRGLGHGGEGHGVGLANVAERLHALFGSAAALEVQEPAAGGVSAVVTLPMGGAPMERNSA